MARQLGQKQILRKVKKLGAKIVGRSVLGLKHANRFGKNVKKQTKQGGKAITTIEKLKM
tara:strand:- start:1311 stop:1487 length:177 start_codon:yes stop_codon:yes gene_type:complete